MQIRQTIEMIKNANDESQLHRFTVGIPSLPGLPISASLPILPPHLEAPFPVVKAKRIASLKPKLNAALQEHLRLNPQRWQPLVADTIRNSIQAGLLAMAFLKITKYHNKVQNKSRSQTAAPSDL